VEVYYENAGVREYWIVDPICISISPILPSRWIV